MRPVPRIVANLTKTAGASSVQFLITLLTTPIMTRLYDPAAYATFGIVNGAANVMVGIGLLSLPSAYAGEKREGARPDLMRTMLVMLIGLVLLAMCSVVAAAIMPQVQRHIPVSSQVLLLLPLLVLTYGVRQILLNAEIQRGNFTRIAMVQVVEPLCSRGGSIAAGAASGGHPALILVSVVMGQLLAIRMFLKHTPKHLWARWRELLISVQQLKATLGRYTDFMFFNTASQQIQPLVILLLQTMLAVFCSPEMSGQFILAISILALPGTLIALATAPVTYHHLTELAHARPEKLLPHLVALIMVYLVGASLIFAPVFFFGEPLFRIAFGSSWGHAGVIAAVLSIAQVGSFAVIGVQSIFMVTRRLKLQFTLDAMMTVPTVVFAAYSFKHLPFDTAIFYLSAAWCVRHAALLVACVLSAMAPRKEMPHA